MRDPSPPEIPFDQLPPILRVLNVAAVADDWLERCLAEDAVTAMKMDTEDLAAAMVRLRVENYDCLVLHHDRERLNALSTVTTIRTVFPHQPIVVLGDSPAEQLTAACLEASADAYVCRTSTGARMLLWVLARAVERQQLIVTTNALRSSAQSQQRQHQQTVLHQLRAQKSLLLEFATSDPQPPVWLKDQFLELLKVYVVSGRGNPRDAVGPFVGTLSKSRVTVGEALLAHTFATEELVLGFGQRPAWHIVSRANLMAYELVMQMRAEPLDESELTMGVGQKSIR